MTLYSRDAGMKVKIDCPVSLDCRSRLKPISVVRRLNAIFSSTVITFVINSASIVLGLQLYPYGRK